MQYYFNLNNTYTTKKRKICRGTNFLNFIKKKKKKTST